MKRKPLALILLMVLALSLLGVTAANAQEAQATLVVINYIGMEMMFTVDDILYDVPGTDTVPGGGQLELTLIAGRHDYSGTVPGGPGSYGQLDLAAGQTYVLGARLDMTPAVISPEGKVLEKPKHRLDLFEASLTPAAPTSAPPVSRLRALPPGQGALVLDNYIGEDLRVDINGSPHIVPAKGRLQVNLLPGRVSYSASAGPSSINGTAQVTAGQYTGLGFNRELPVTREYNKGKPKPTTAVLKMSVSVVTLTPEPVGQAAVTPAPVTVTTTPTATTQSVTADTPALLVINYTGRPLMFTIDSTEHQLVAGEGKLTISLAPGEYPFTASIPGVSFNSDLRLAAGDSLRLSVTATPDGKWIKVYVDKLL